jgi:hypothetical protein
MSCHFRGLMAVVPALLLLGSAGLRAQSLADVAKQEEERRKAIKQPAKVYTNKDLRGVPSPIDVPPETTKPAAEPAASGDSGASAAKSSDAGRGTDAGKSPERGDSKTAGPSDKGPAKDQAYWAERMKQLKAQLDRDQTYLDALQSRVSALTADFSKWSDPAQRQVIGRDRQKALDELERLKKAIASDKKALTDLEDEARRAGVPAGWLRS